MMPPSGERKRSCLLKEPASEGAENPAHWLKGGSADLPALLEPLGKQVKARKPCGPSAQRAWGREL